MNGPSPRDGRQPEIDWLKGFAILCVLLIHAKPLEGYVIQAQLINRAVPIFVVLFGMTSERWWRSRESLPLGRTLWQWYRSRLERLMIPVWGTLVAWWTLEIFYRRFVPPEPWRILATALGYLPWVGTGWFVTLVLELVILFPLIHFGIKKLGDSFAILLAAAILMVSYAEMLPAIELMRLLLHDTAANNSFFYFWIFAPAWLFGVTVGAVLTRRRAQIRPSHAAISLALAWLVVETAAYAQVDLRGQRAAAALADPLVAIGLLGLIPVVAWWEPAARLLAWCGAWSWGIYLGQLIVHNCFFAFGMNLTRLSSPLRWGYFMSLFVGAVGLASIGEALRSTPLREWVPCRPSSPDTRPG